ncbi:MAG TPA: ABC transporter substrate-binding protein, partial [Actinobacteria bacterium]|nr:ABC transporter substrate-binding protein [Actinomycetes bacterium]HEX21469.1 ABC transporter substrate-binding protein [Actinomycetota bacterium]
AAVAKSWSSNPEATVFTFHLKHGTKFHNGREVTAGDFKYAWERVAAKDSGSDVAYHLAPIKGFEEMQTGKAKHLSGLKVKGKYTLIVTLNYPFADFPYILGHPVFSPVPKEDVEKNPKAFAKFPIGNGPFMMAAPWKHRRYIKVKRFNKYYGTKPLLDSVEFRIFADKDIGFMEFKSGSLDYAPIPLGQVKATDEEYGNNAVIGQPLLSLDFLGYNSRSRPLNNKNLRRAISYGIDRKAISDAIFEDVRLPASGIIPPPIGGAIPPAKSFETRFTKAKELLKKAGYPGGKGLKKLKLTYISGSDYGPLAEAIQGNLSKLNIQVDIQPMEAGAFFKALHTGDTSLFIVNWAADYPTMDSFIYPLFYSKSEDNVVGYRNKAVDRLIIKARKTLDAKTRHKLYKQAESDILADTPIAPLFYDGTAALHGRDVRGFIRTSLDYTPLEQVWLKKK